LKEAYQEKRLEASGALVVEQTIQFHGISSDQGKKNSLP